MYIFWEIDVCLVDPNTKRIGDLLWLVVRISVVLWLFIKSPKSDGDISESRWLTFRLLTFALKSVFTKVDFPSPLLPRKQTIPDKTIFELFGKTFIADGQQTSSCLE